MCIFGDRPVADKSRSMLVLENCGVFNLSLSTVSQSHTARPEGRAVKELQFNLPSALTSRLLKA